MKKLISLFISYALFATQLFAIYPNQLNNTTWEIRPWATAGNVNGCGFSTSDNRGNEFGGTDYTQQETAQLTITDLASSSATDCRLTSVTGGFTSAMKGNKIHITACTNCQPDWYTIVSVFDSNTIAVDSSPCGGGIMSAGTARVGGACSLNSTLDAEMFNNVASSNVVWVASGTISFGETVNMNSSRIVYSTPAWLVGYYQIRGDYPNVFKPWTNSTSYSLLNVGANAFTMSVGLYVQNLSIVGNASTVLTGGSNSLIENCRIYNNSTTSGRLAFSPGTLSAIRNNEIMSNKGIALNLNGAEAYAEGNYIHDSRTGIILAASRQRVVNNLITNCSLGGIVSTAGGSFYNLYGNTIDGFKNISVGTGIVTQTSVPITMTNNIVANWYKGVGGEFSNGFKQKSCILRNNAFYNCKTTSTDLVTYDSTNLLITTQPFTDDSEIFMTTAACTSLTNEIKMHGGGFFTNSGITDGKDFIFYVGGNATDVQPGNYLIISHSSYSVTTITQACNQTAANHIMIIPKGRDFSVNSSLKAMGSPYNFYGSSSTSYIDIGSVQRREPDPTSGSGTGFIIQ